MGNELFEHLGSRRLLAPHVEGGAGHLAAFQGAQHGFFVDDSAAGAVDDDHAILHSFEMLGPDQVAGFLIEGRMHGDDVRIADDVLQGNQAHAQVVGPLLGDIGIAGDDLRLEGPGAQRNPTADLAQADDPDGLSLELIAGKRRPFPLAALEAGVGHGDIAAQRQKDGQGVLRGRIDIAEGSVDHDDPLVAGGFDIDVVDAHSGPGHDLQSLGMLQQGSIHAGAATGDDGLILANDLVKFRNGQTEFDIELDSGIVEQGLQPFLRDFIGDENFHRASFTAWNCKCRQRRHLST